MIAINFPFVLYASDYHEFDATSKLLTKLTGANVLYKEIDLDVALQQDAVRQIMRRGNECYAAIFSATN
jgi:hypothetical protein